MTYATKYYWAHPDITSPEQFVFTDEDYSDFKAFLETRNFNYKTDTEESVNELIANAKKEKYYDSHEELLLNLQKDISHNLDQDLNQFRSEITEIIEDDIISRYFYEKGAIEWTLKKDEQILKARDVLNNKAEYASILKGTSGAIVVK